MVSLLLRKDSFYVITITTTLMFIYNLWTQQRNFRIITTAQIIIWHVPADNSDIKQEGLCSCTHFFYFCLSSILLLIHRSGRDLLLQVTILSSSVFRMGRASSTSRIRYVMMMILLCSCIRCRSIRRYIMLEFRSYSILPSAVSNIQACSCWSKHDDNKTIQLMMMTMMPLLLLLYRLLLWTVLLVLLLHLY